MLRADRIVFNRNTGTAAATGHVVLLEPDGEVLFADYAEVTNNMRDAVLKDMRARLAENGKLAANGARRFGGVLNELSKVVYSPCNLCKENPESATALADPRGLGNRRTCSTSASNIATPNCRCSASRWPTRHTCRCRTRR